MKAQMRRESEPPLRRWLPNTLSGAPFFLNLDEEVVENIVSGLVRNKRKYEYACCPAGTWG